MPDGLTQKLVDFLPALIAITIAGAVLWLVNRIFLRKVGELHGEGQFRRQITMLGLSAAGIVAVLLTLPIQESTRNQLLGLLGLVLTAVIALSSTSFVSNIMAGLMLRSVNSFKPGDFLQVGDEFGRVTERGLFHTEIQTRDRDLTTLPNLYLVTHPFNVVHAEGTIVSATVSLGYDVPRSQVEGLLAEAADAAGLEKPFVRMDELGDHSVTYRVAGFLPEVRQLLTKRSDLRKRMFDTLHKADIEIVSPTVMNQRVLQTDSRIVPPAESRTDDASAHDDPESRLFDKAERAQQLEQLKVERGQLQAEIKDLEAKVPKAGDDDRVRLERGVTLRRDRLATVERLLEHQGS